MIVWIEISGRHGLLLKPRFESDVELSCLSLAIGFHLLQSVDS